MKRQKIILPVQYLAFSDILSKKRAAEDESNASDVDGELTDYVDHETDSEMVVGNNPVLVEYNDLYQDTDLCNLRPFNH
ncbi:hypothetical protein AVEN_267978-1 [Araneus ventricosus]|uniref:Uncharacterized protein n=1 Tax=Araneus ventricosus TaxID=182803 RepID=A0A4Y2IYG1_ARAVE|nr:hypothetical protein AVEN_267978-1 [Araneus ventricosus]